MKEGLVGRIVLYAKTAAYFDFVMREPGNKFFDDVGSLAMGVDFQVFGRQDT